MSTIEKEKPAPVPKMFKVTIYSGEDATDKGDVPLVHNFKQILIQRDKEVTISEAYVECLKHAVVDTTIKAEDGTERQVRIPRFAFSASPA